MGGGLKVGGRDLQTGEREGAQNGDFTICSHVRLTFLNLQQVRDLLKGTLAFRGSTMETECDFMEIDNNIASRLQIPSQHQQKDGDMPENLPVPMLANFGHFENSDETESSFMSGDVESNDKGESERSSETGKENSAMGFTTTAAEASETTEGVLEQQAKELETFNTVVSAGKLDENAENPKEDIAAQEGEINDGTGNLFSSFGEGNATIESIDSNPLFCGERHIVDTEKQTDVDSSIVTTSPPSRNRVGVEDERGEPDNGQSILNHQKGSTTISSATDPLFNTISQLSLQGSDPLSGRENSNDSSSEGLFRTESLDREFVFVNQDGTAQNEPRPPRHPLESSDEF